MKNVIYKLFILDIIGGSKNKRLTLIFYYFFVCGQNQKLFKRKVNNEVLPLVRNATFGGSGVRGVESRYQTLV